MYKGLNRFDVLLQQLESLMKASEAAADPAGYLYLNDARSVLFRLEALSRLYSHIHNTGRFEKLKDRFKELEDLLGDIDHYSEHLEFANTHYQEDGIKNYFSQKRDEKLAELNEVLRKREWTGSNARFKKIRKKLEGADWLKEKDEIKAIYTFYQDAIVELNVFYADLSHPFTDMENEVHEMRRDLRWLSIYPHALQGSVQLSNSGHLDEQVQKYLTPEVVNSPFNKMPESDSGKYILLLEKDYFLALSWMISELGVIKDKGLEILALKEAKEGNPLEDHSIPEGEEGYEEIQELLLRATAICKAFFEERNLEKMLSS